MSVASGPATTTRVCETLAAVCGKFIAARFQFVSAPQLACWALFLLSIVCHSLTSAVVLAAGLAACAAVAHWLPGGAETAFDMGFVYNLLAVLLALGARCLQLRPATVAWLIVVAVLLALGWGPLSALLASFGTRPLCLPFNVVVLGTLLLCHGLRRWGLAELLVPLEVAVTSPEAVRLSARKRRDRTEDAGKSAMWSNTDP